MTPVTFRHIGISELHSRQEKALQEGSVWAQMSRTPLEQRVVIEVLDRALVLSCPLERSWAYRTLFRFYIPATVGEVDALRQRETAIFATLTLYRNNLLKQQEPVTSLQEESALLRRIYASQKEIYHTSIEERWESAKRALVEQTEEVRRHVQLAQKHITHSTQLPLLCAQQLLTLHTQSIDALFGAYLLKEELSSVSVALRPQGRSWSAIACVAKADRESIAWEQACTRYQNEADKLREALARALLPPPLLRVIHKSAFPSRL
jgi:hypothetical protein